MARKILIKDDGVEGFFRRGHETARKLDNKEPIKAETIITFENSDEMWACLTPQRKRLIQTVKQSEGTPITALVARLNRPRRAVDRDVNLLAKNGLLRTSYVANPGHGRVKMVEPVAHKYHLTTIF